MARAQTHEYLGYAYAALAAAPNASASEGRERMIAARDMFRKALSILGDARNQGILSAANEQWAKEIAAEIAKCDAALAK